MLSLCRIDAAFRRLQEYDPDFDVTLLSVEDTGLSETERQRIAVQARIIRITLVARIADIVKQASTEAASLDVAVAMVEVLISCTSVSCGKNAGRGHKHATQAIQLLASIYGRFNEAIDLFFDLVERSCAQSRTQGTMQNNAARCTDVFATRMMQNYDQMLLKLISKHWNAVGPLGNWDIDRALERIQALRDVYEVREGSKATILAFLKRHNAASLFCESRRVLRRMQKERVSELVTVTVTAATDGRSWTPRKLVPRRSSPTMRVERVSQESSSSENKSIVVSVKEASDDCFEALDTKDWQQNISHFDAFVIPETDLTSLYTITEKAETEVVEIETFPDFASFGGSIG